MGKREYIHGSLTLQQEARKEDNFTQRLSKRAKALANLVQILLIIFMLKFSFLLELI